MSHASDMTKYSLRSWVLVLALAPTILVGILLGSYFTIDRFYELEENLTQQGGNIIEPLAMASEIGLKNNDRETSKRLLATAQLNSSPLVKSIAIFDANNQVFVTSHYHKNFEVMRYKENLNQLQHTTHEFIGDMMVLRTPIFISDGTESSTIAKPFTENDTLSDIDSLIATNKGKHLGYIALILNKEKALLEQHRAAVAAFIIVLIGVQLNLLFTFRLVKNVTQPITEMVRVVAKIREGKLDTRLHGNLIGELDLLKRGINAMAGSLSEYHDEMQQNIDQATSDLRETLEQIEIQNVELDLAKKRALEASRIKSEFLANMSHELRTPLNGVIGFTRQLLKTPLHASQMEYLQTIERSATNLLSIINDILDFSKLEAGKMVLENMPFGLRDLLDDTTTLLADSAREKGLELVVDIDPKVPDNLNGDAMRVGQIITNLLGNAIKFTDKGSVLLKIKPISNAQNKVTLRCEVIDTGIGIDEKHQEMLFQAFGQTDSSISRRFGGTGLGLVITKRLVNQMGGQIGFNSTPNKGSTFWFILPLALSKFSAQKNMHTENLKNRNIALYEPRRLSMDVMTRQLTFWKTKVTALKTKGELDKYIGNGANKSHVDCFLLSTLGFKNQKELDETVSQISQYTNNIVLINDAQEQHIMDDKNQRHISKIMTPPIGEHALARNLLCTNDSQKVAIKIVDDTPQNISPHSIKVLAVDDNEANLKLIDTLLKELVTNVVTVNSGDKAIAKAKQTKFDLIFMDIQMPGTDGLTATKVIRQNSINRNTPIIAVTAHAMAEEKKSILSSGIDGYLTKPIDENALKGIIKRWISGPTFGELDANTLNWELCLTQTNQKSNLAIDMLSMFLESLPSTTQQIKASINNNKAKQMLEVIHKLHGASCYCGVPNTQKLCKEIEYSLKQGASTEDLEPEILELLDELTKVELAAKQVISQLSTDVKNDQQSGLLQTS